MTRLISVVLVGLCHTSFALAEDTDALRGKALAQANCAICHATGARDKSTMAASPPFRDIATHYDQNKLERALSKGVPTDHPAMPDWQMTPEQARQFSTYIMSLGIYGMKKSEMQR
jgi:mono/diheme cytochrome c family protein